LPLLRPEFPSLSPCAEGSGGAKSFSRVASIELIDVSNGMPTVTDERGRRARELGAAKFLTIPNHGQ
jgi:hypothetical protein